MVTYSKRFSNNFPICTQPEINLTWLWCFLIGLICFAFFFFFLWFLAAPMAFGALGQGSDQSHSLDLSCSCYNAGFLTHCACAGPGIKPASQLLSRCCGSCSSTGGAPALQFLNTIHKHVWNGSKLFFLLSSLFSFFLPDFLQCFCLFVCFCQCLQHAEAPWPGIKTTSQQWPEPQQWQSTRPPGNFLKFSFVPTFSY